MTFSQHGSMVTPTISNARSRGREDRGAADKSSAFAPAQEAGARERGCRRSGNGSCAVCRWFVGEHPPDCHVCGALSRSASCLSPPQGDDRFAGLQYSCSRKCFTKHLRLCFLSASGVRMWGDRIFEKCGIGRDERGDGGKTLEIRGKRRLSARDGGANYQQS